MAKRDYSDWLTKQQAADAIQVSTKTIEKLAQDKKLQYGKLTRAGKPAIVVYHPGDVDRVRRERNPDAEPFVLPPGDTAPDKPQEAALARRVAPAEAPAMAAFMQLLQAAKTSDAGIQELKHKLFLTMKEAALYSGLPPVYLRRMIDEGKLKTVVVNGAGSVRLRRSDLELL